MLPGLSTARRANEALETRIGRQGLEIPVRAGQVTVPRTKCNRGLQMLDGDIDVALERLGGRERVLHVVALRTSPICFAQVPDGKLEVASV